jgi:hypothetical protein
MHSDSAIAPRIFQLVASIGDVNKLHAKPAGSIFKTTRLVTELRGKEQQSFGRIRHGSLSFFMKSWLPACCERALQSQEERVSSPELDKTISACDRILRQRVRGRR